SDSRAREASHTDFTEAVMEQVTEFMKHRLYVTEAHERRGIVRRRLCIGAKKSDMRGRRRRRDETVHPGAVSLGFARVKVRVEPADFTPLTRYYLMGPDASLPRGECRVDDVDTEERLRQLKRA